MSSVTSENRELPTEHLDDGHRLRRHRAIQPAPSVQEHCGGLMPRTGLALHDEFGLLARGRRLHADPRDIAFVETAFETWSHPHHDPRAVATRDREQESAGL